MLRKIILLILVISVFINCNIIAQNDLPRLSPKAFVGQTIGYTEVVISYGSPGVKKREIFGALVPCDQVWRTGANEATTIEFSGDVKVNNRSVPSGRYSLFTIPGKKEWTIILNKVDDQWGAFKYDEKEDLLRFKVKPVKNNFIERLRFTFEYKSPFLADIIIEWENVKVAFSVDTKTEKKE